MTTGNHLIAALSTLAIAAMLAAPEPAAAGEIGEDFTRTEVRKEQGLTGAVCRRIGGGRR